MLSANNCTLKDDRRSEISEGFFFSEYLMLALSFMSFMKINKRIDFDKTVRIQGPRIKILSLKSISRRTQRKISKTRSIFFFTGFKTKNKKKPRFSIVVLYLYGYCFSPVKETPMV